MRVDGLEVQLARDQEDDGLDGGKTRAAARASLGGLEQTVDGRIPLLNLSARTWFPGAKKPSEEGLGALREAQRFLSGVGGVRFVPGALLTG